MQNDSSTLIERMKSDFIFRSAVLSEANVADRIAKCREAGYNVKQEDFLSNTASNSISEARENLANTWLCKGPCHTKCAPLVIE